MNVKITNLYRYTIMGMLLLALIIVFVTILFIYQDVYRIVVESTVFQEAGLELAIVEPLEIGRWNTVKEYFKTKQQIPLYNLSTVRNPFTN